MRRPRDRPPQYRRKETAMLPYDYETQRLLAREHIDRLLEEVRIDRIARDLPRTKRFPRPQLMLRARRRPSGGSKLEPLAH
jgi:hypothetical protein